MTVIRPNSIAGINSITAQGNSISIFKSDGSSGLELTGATINSSTGISTFNRLSVSNGAVISGVSTISSLNVTGTTTVGLGTTGSPSISPTGDSNTGVFFPSADTIAFAEGGIEAARFDSSGRLLVGTSTALLLDPALANYALNIETFIGGGVLNHSIGATRHGGPTPEAGPVISLARSRGTTAGSVTLVAQNDLLGLVEFCGADGTDFGTTAGSIASYVDGVAGINSMPGRLIFATTSAGASSPTERMRITQDGRVGIKETSFLGNAALAIGSSGSTNNDVYLRNNGTQALSVGFIQTALTSKSIACTTNDRINVFSNSDTATGVYLAANGTSWTSTSDERLKENLSPIRDGLLKVASLRAVTGNYINDPAKKKVPFLIAQDIEAVLPEAVDSSDPDELGLSYTGVIPLLVAALKESKERIETLEAKVAALESA